LSSDEPVYDARDHRSPYVEVDLSIGIHESTPRSQVADALREQFEENLEALVELWWSFVQLRKHHQN
jgi:hypothetical protein